MNNSKIFLIFREIKVGSLIAVYDNFLSYELINRIENEINALNVEEYHKVKFLFNWLPNEIIKEKNVIKYSENISGKLFSNLSKDIRANIAIKYGFDACDTQIHFDNKSLLNIVVPIFMRELKDSGLVIFPLFPSFLLRPFLKFKLISKIIRKNKLIKVLLRAKHIKYETNKGYIFKGSKLAHGVFFKPLSQDSLRAVLTINFRKF